MRAIDPHAAPAPPAIRRAALSDMAELERIEREAFANPWSTQLMRAAVASSGYDVRVLHTARGSLLGFYIAHRDGPQSNLDNLAVDAPRRGRGHGTELLHDWIARSLRRSLHTLTLQVNVDNRAAQGLYQRFGFRTTQRLTAYYPNGEDAFEMERLLRRRVRRPWDPALHPELAGFA